jgi:Type VI secretion system VasI, EvfG, VC_A0118
MKTILAVLALCASAQGTLAAGADCRSIPGTGERLACYDAATAAKKDKPAAVETDASRSAYKDPLIEEDARTNAKLKNICRGCWCVRWKALSDAPSRVRFVLSYEMTAVVAAGPPLLMAVCDAARTAARSWRQRLS